MGYAVLIKLVTRLSALGLLTYCSSVNAASSTPLSDSASNYTCNPQCVSRGPNGRVAVSAQLLQSRFKTDVEAVQSTDVAPLSLRQGLYLWQAVQAAVSAYPSIRSAVATLSQQGSGVDAARAGYYPSVKAGINSGRHGNMGNGQVLSVNAEQMLYDFGKVSSSVSYAEASTERQLAKVLATMDDVARQTSQAVVEVHRYQLQEVAAKRQIAALEDLLKVARVRAQGGASTQADPVQASSRLDAAQSTLQAVQTQLRQWRSKLKTLVRQPLPERIGNLPARELQQAVSAFVPQLRDVPQLQVAQLELLMAKAQLERAKAAQLPTVSVSAGVDQYLGGLRGQKDDHDYNLTLNVSNSLFEGGALRAQERAAQYGITSAEENIQTLHLEIEDKWQSVTEQIDGIEARLPLLAARQSSIIETRRLYREQYLSLGTRTLLDLLNSEQEIFQAELEQQNALHDLLQARLDYLQATGRMRDVFRLSTQMTAGVN
ncbi:TolC family outer membrane protein [Pseudomonas sp. 5P_3.1_Bac2]|uniref:TolC family outer membrane protein n=1 Tax=Pseudomonas sp. 5P_3.1_Bac2 TaxID=2971617 RepID=UPI0021CA7EA9|nr:TolC family outer membrane protein [Pseudomonas sp. 5P_3.1_Bac2]MCU1715764.1 TolC family outer membrane protein [Pseudomonas sp. 5P_3.1_Bac2]